MLTRANADYRKHQDDVAFAKRAVKELAEELGPSAFWPIEDQTIERDPHDIRINSRFGSLMDLRLFCHGGRKQIRMATNGIDYDLSLAYLKAIKDRCDRTKS